MNILEKGKLIRETRERKGITYRAMAEAMGLNSTTTFHIRKLETGENVRLDTFLKSCEVLGLKVMIREES